MRTILSISGATFLLVGLLAAGCGDDSSSDGDVQVTVSTTQAADLARNVAGDRAEITGILSTNSDPHDYEPQPSDAESLLDADLIIESGGDVDPWMGELVESSGSDAPELTLIDHVDTREGEGDSEEGVDPHWWQDPTNAILAVEAIRDELIEADPDGAETYEANADAYIDRLTALDEGIAKCMDEVPVDQRKLVTSHDALGYYADRYDIEIIGAVIPALTTQAQASAGETAELVELIRETGVSTIFPEAGVSQQLEDAIASEADAEVGPELWADTLGPEGSDGATYIESLESNTTNLVEGFTAGAESCSFEDATG